MSSLSCVSPILFAIRLIALIASLCSGGRSLRKLAMISLLGLLRDTMTEYHSCFTFEAEKDIKYTYTKHLSAHKPKVYAVNRINRIILIGNPFWETGRWISNEHK